MCEKEYKRSDPKKALNLVMKKFFEDVVLAHRHSLDQKALVEYIPIGDLRATSFISSVAILITGPNVSE